MRIDIDSCPCMVAVGKPAPDWNGTAVVDGDFKEIRLSDFKGKALLPSIHYCN